jgi:hypothetical protein
MRTMETMVTFHHPFVLSALETAQPAGTYRNGDGGRGLSFVAFRRTATMLHLPALPATGATHQVVSVDPVEWPPSWRRMAGVSRTLLRAGQATSASLENHLSVGTRRIRLGAKHADVNGIRDREPHVLVLHAPRWIEVHPCANWLVLVLFPLFLLLVG